MARPEINQCENEYTYNDNGDIIHCRRRDGTESWFDGHGRTIRKKDHHGNESWYEYDDRGNVIHEKHSSAFRAIETWWEYDANGNVIHWWDSGGYEAWREHYENGNPRHYKDSNGYEEWYDSNGKHISKEQYDKLYGSRVFNPCDGKVIEVDGKKYKLVPIDEE